MYTEFLRGMANRGKGKTKGLITWKKYGGRMILVFLAAIHPLESCLVRRFLFVRGVTRLFRCAFWPGHTDWLEPGRVPSLNIIGEMGSAFNYGQTLRIARDTATSLGHTADATLYESEYVTLKTAFHAAYWDPAKKTYGNGQQAALVYALYLGAVPAENDAAVFSQLLGLIHTAPQPPDHLTPKAQQCGKPPCLDTGIIATKWLMELLSIRGRTDVGLALAFQTDYPSWGYMAAMNSTTVWEHW